MTQPYYTFSSPDYSRPSSRDSENSHQASYMPVQSTSGPSVANPQQNTSQSHSFNQNSQSHYLQLATQEVLPLNKNASSGPSVANPQQNTSQSHSFNQNSQSHYLQLDTQEVLPLNKNASSQLTNLQDDNSGFKWN
ncbi:hypothetical protein QE152_g40052 [Popillia japonica]